MEFTQMKNIFSSHGVEVKVENERMFALEEWFDTITKENGSKWIDVTNYTLTKVKHFLGY